MNVQEVKLQELIEQISPVHPHWREHAMERTSRLVMPFRALGRLHEMAEKICAIRRTLTPSVKTKAVLVMAGDHGVCEEGVSAYPQVITGEMVKAFLSGGAGISVMARHVGADVYVVDMGIIPEMDPGGLAGRERFWVRKVGQGTANFTRGPAMTREQAVQAILTGFSLASDLFQNGLDILGTGDMGIGNTTPAAAVGAVMTGVNLKDMVGRGTGVDEDGLARKRNVIQRGIGKNRPNPKDGLDVLAKIGGFEIGGIVGCVLAGAFHCRPVVIDGFISTAGLLIAHALCPHVLDYVFAGHCSDEQGHGHMLTHLGIRPILDLGMRLGEGTGGVMAMTVIEAGIKVFQEVSTFEEAGVTKG